MGRGARVNEVATLKSVPWTNRAGKEARTCAEGVLASTIGLIRIR
jgi:hypothetical protein